MKKIRTLIFLSALAAVWMPATASAIGVSATPATLSIHATAGKEGVARFIVSNPSKEVGLFEAYPEEFEKFITIIPSRFVLEAGEKREVIVRATRHEIGIIRTAIAIEVEPLGKPPLGVGGGVRLPFSFEVSEESQLLSAVSLSGASKVGVWFFLGALTVLLLFRRVSLYTLKRFARRGKLGK